MYDHRFQTDFREIRKYRVWIMARPLYGPHVYIHTMSSDIYLCRLHAYDFCLFDVCMRVFVARLVYLLLLRLCEHTPPLMKRQPEPKLLSVCTVIQWVSNGFEWKCAPVSWSWRLEWPSRHGLAISAANEFGHVYDSCVLKGQGIHLGNSTRKDELLPTHMAMHVFDVGCSPKLSQVSNDTYFCFDHPVYLPSDRTTSYSLLPF